MLRHYVAPQYPEKLIKTEKKEASDAQYEAANILAETINSGELPDRIPDGFSVGRLIEIEKTDLMAENEEDIVRAVKVLSKLSHSKQKMQEVREKAKLARQTVDSLFSDQTLTSEEFDSIRKSLRVLKLFASASSSYKKALIEAEAARSILDKATDITG